MKPFVFGTGWGEEREWFDSDDSPIITLGWKWVGANGTKKIETLYIKEKSDFRISFQKKTGKSGFKRTKKKRKLKLQKCRWKSRDKPKQFGVQNWIKKKNLCGKAHMYMFNSRHVHVYYTWKAYIQFPYVDYPGRKLVLRYGSQQAWINLSWSFNRGLTEALTASNWSFSGQGGKWHHLKTKSLLKGQDLLMGS